MTREAVGLSVPQGEDKADPADLAQAKALSNETPLQYTVSRSYLLLSVKYLMILIDRCLLFTIGALSEVPR